MSYSVETVAEEHRVPVIQKCRRFPEAEVKNPAYKTGLLKSLKQS